MPPLSYSRLNARTDPAGRNFTIIFATAAVVVVVSCLVFGYIVPKYRKRRPSRPSSGFFTNPPGGVTSNHFPCHPALCRSLRKRPSTQLRQYDPRCETPFPSAPPLGESISLPSVTPRSLSAIDLRHASHGRSSPVGNRLPSRRGARIHEADTSNSVTGSETVDEHCFSVTLPEPCLLQARSAGKAPPLKRQLEKFPLPRCGSNYSDRLAHPNKLFRDLELRDSQTSVDTPSPMPPDDELRVSRLSEAFSAQHARLRIGRAKRHEKKIDNSVDLPQVYEMKHWRLRRLERRGTWSSNIDPRPDHFPVLRAGTLTRLETPVADIHSLYDSKRSLKPPSWKNGTLTSSGYQDSTFSSRIDVGTPPTSPVEDAKRNAHPQVDRGDMATPTSPTPYLGYDRATPSSMALPSTDRLSPMCTIPEGRPTDARKPSIFKKVRPLARNRPARLNFTNMGKSPSIRKRLQRHSTSSVGSLLVPLVRSTRPSILASSIYSRDTLGVSITRSPVSPAFSENTSGKPSVKAGPLHRKASSMDLLKTKIDDWHLDTPEIEKFSTSPSSGFKRALSDLGPYSPNFPDSAFSSVCKFDKGAHERAEGIGQKDLPRICIGRASDDIFRDSSPDIESGRVFKTVLDMEIAASMSSFPQVPKNGTAPGGADWL